MAGPPRAIEEPIATSVKSAIITFRTRRTGWKMGRRHQGRRRMTWTQDVITAGRGVIERPRQMIAEELAAPRSAPAMTPHQRTAPPARRCITMSGRSCRPIDTDPRGPVVEARYAEASPALRAPARRPGSAPGATPAPTRRPAQEPDVQRPRHLARRGLPNRATRTKAASSVKKPSTRRKPTRRRARHRLTTAHSARPPRSGGSR